MRYKNRKYDNAYLKIRKLLIKNPDLGRYKIMELTGLPEKIVRNRIKWYEKDCEANPPAEEFEQKENGDAEFYFETEKEIKTKEDAIQIGNVDVSKWEIAGWKTKNWQGFYKDSKGKPKKVQMHGVHLSLKPKVIDTENFIENLKKQMTGTAPAVPNFHKRKKGNYMLELDIMDLHIGKLCWAPETGGETWNVKKAIRQSHEAVEDLIYKSENYDFSQILMPVGNDLLHIDNLLGETNAGTHQDVDGRVHKLFMDAIQMLTAQINRLKKIAPVYIPIIAGNHDLEKTFHIGFALWCRFENDKNVTVNWEPSSRKYFKFGKTLIGFCHGSRLDPPAQKLPQTMAVERPMEWATSRHRHWHIGHLHKSKSTTSLISEDSFQGTVVKIIRSLTPPDYWHFNKGFIQPNQRGAESYIYDKDEGLIQQNLTYG